MQRTLSPLASRCSVLVAAISLHPGCLGTTPYPVPPTIDPEKVSIVDQQNGSVVVAGQEGAVDPPDQSIRVTSSGGGSDAPIPELVEVSTGPLGTFSVNVAGRPSDLFYIEVLTSGVDLFVIAVTGGPADSAVAADPGPDSDSDGSPDAIDCAPDDESQLGRQCG